MPEFEEEFKKYEEATGSLIKDGGVLPCQTCPFSSNASKMILVQSSEQDSLQTGISSLLNVLEAAEAMQSQVVSMPILSSFSRVHMAKHTIWWTIDFAHLLNPEWLKTIKIVTDDILFMD